MAIDAEQVASCATEPIHIPGAVQEHGCLLVMSADLRVQQASRNCDRYLGMPVPRLLGKPLCEVIGTEQEAQVRRAQHAVGGHLANRNLVQARDQPVAVRLVDHERDVEIVRGLRDKINLLLFEQFERVAQSMQDCSDVSTNEADCSARANHLHAANLR